MSEKVSMSFKVMGRVFTCEGAPSNKERHFFDLVIQRSVPDGDVAACYRENFPECPDESDDAIHAKYQKRLQKKKAKGGSKEDVSAPPSPVTEKKSEKKSKRESASDMPPQQAPAQPAPAPDAAPGGDVAAASATMSADEVRDLNRFITEVLQEDGTTTTTTTSAPPPEPAKPRVPSPVQPVTPTTTERTAGNPASASDQRFAVFLQLEGAESQKMVNVKCSNTFDEVLEAVQRKLGTNVALSFVDADSMRIDVDDDDTLQMFLQQDNVKRLTLKCTPVAPVVAKQQAAMSANIPSASPVGAHTTVFPGSAAASAAHLPAPSEGPPTTRVTPNPSIPASGASTSNANALVKTFCGHTSAVYGCAFSPDGTQIASASRDRTVKIWNVEKGTTTQTIKAHNGFVLSCDFSPRGTHIASCSDDQTIKLFSVTGKKNYTIKEHTDKVYCVQFAPHGDTMMSCSCDATVKVWNVENGSRVASVKPHDKAIFRIGLSHTDNGRHIVTSCDDHTSAIVDWKEGRIVRKLLGHGNTIWSASFSFDDRYVVTSSMDHTIKMWDVGSGREICTFHGHSTPVHSVMFCQKSRDTALVSCARDWTIGLWDVASTKLTQTYAGHTNTVYSIAQRDDMLLSSSLDESLKLWKLPNYNI